MFIQASVQGYQVPVAADPNVTPDPRDRVSQECVGEDTLLRERAKTRERERARERESAHHFCVTEETDFKQFGCLHHSTEKTTNFSTKLKKIISVHTQEEH